MERELDIALRTAREWAADAEDVGRLAQMARVFLAQHERVAALEAERDGWRIAWEGVNTHCNKLRDALAAAESRLAAARVEGAREALTRLRHEFGEGTGDRGTIGVRGLTDYAHNHVEHFRDREYPAPSAHAGEARPCERNGPCIAPASCEAGETCYGRPAPTPEPEKNVYLPVGILSHRGAFVPSASMVRVTPEDCRRIVALGSRPTQTAEG